MNYVKHIKSNIAGGVDLELGHKTLIVGPSAGGKTTVVRALELALAGGTSDLEGRAWTSDDTRLLALLPPGADELWSEASIGTADSDGQIASFRKKAGSNADPKGLGMPVLALQSVRENLTGSADKARNFILDAACKLVTTDDIIKRLPAGLHDAYNAASVGRKGNPIDVLKEAQTHAAARARKLKSEAKGAKSTVDALTSTEGAPTEEQVREAIAHAQLLQSRLVEMRAATHTQKMRLDLQHHIDQHTSAIEHLEAQLVPIAAPGQEDIQMQQKWARASALKSVVAAQRTRPTECQLCGTTHETGLTDRMNAMDSAIDQALSQFSERQEALEFYGKVSAKLATLTAARASYEEQLANLSTGAQGPLGIEALEAEAAAAEARRQKLLAAHSTAEQLQRARALAHEALEKADRFKRLADACKDVITELVTAHLSGFVARVNQYMPKNMVFAVESGTRFRIGLMKNETLYTALSGAEWVAVTTAIGSAVTENAALAVLLPEERAYDGFMLARIMRGLSDAPAQVVLTSTVSYKGKLPKGWTVIQLEESAS